MSKIVCFGEVLWDVFSTHKKIGGAPLNVAVRLKSFSHEVSMISAIGDDDLGKLILEFLKEKGVNTTHIQVLKDFETGEVQVTLNKKGAATYKIIHPKAWDKIEFTKTASDLVKHADAFVFGSLITRDNVSKNTLSELLKFANYKVFDVNLRKPFFDKKILLELMKEADFIKFNDEELYEIASYLGSPFHNLEQNVYFLAKKTETKHICVTKGEHGALLLYDSELYYNSGYQVKVADTVGSGDSFLATLISSLLQKETPQKAINKACAVGALVAQKEGANPIISDEELSVFMNLN
jgi:fructokinase